MKEVLLSTRPKWCEKIGSGEKKAEVRKTRPKEVPFKCLIYCTQEKYYGKTLYINPQEKRNELGVSQWWCDTVETNFINENTPCEFKCYKANGKVIGEFICDSISEFHEWQLSPSKRFFKIEQAELDIVLKQSCLTYNEICKYREELPYYKPLYLWHISNLVIYDKPKKLSDFNKLCPTKKEYDCENCERSEQYVCANYLTRPPQSWQYVLDK